MEPVKRGRGRPAGRKFTHKQTLRLTDDEAERLNRLARSWDCSETAAARLAIDQAAEREGVK